MNRLKEQIDYAKFTENPNVTLDIDYAERLLLELTEQYESPIEEEIIKEWEELGYELTRRERRFISYQNNLGEFIVMSWYSEFTYEKHWNGRSKSINLKEHNLIYKTKKLFEIELGG